MFFYELNYKACNWICQRTFWEFGEYSAFLYLFFKISQKKCAKSVPLSEVQSMGRNIQFFFMALVSELFFRKMRENHVHVGSKVYEGKTEQIFYHNGFEKIFEKAAKNPFASEVKCMRRETVVFSARFFCVKKLLEQCAKNPFMSEVRFMGSEKPSNP